MKCEKTNKIKHLNLPSSKVSFGKTYENIANNESNTITEDILKDGLYCLN